MDSRASWAEARHSLTFRFRGQRIALASFSPRATLLDWLREEAGAKGTKEGCAEGDCGACTVVLSRLRDGALTYEPVNACILLLGQVDGAEVLTIEDLADGDALHPVQQAMVDFHGSQCGFCTPGIVMSLFALYHEREPATYRKRLRGAGGQSLPLHRLQADHRRGAGDLRRRARRPLRGASGRAPRRARFACGRARSLRRRGGRVLRRAGERGGARRSLCPLSRRRPRWRGDRRRPVDHQAIARSQANHLARPRRGARRDRGNRRRPAARRERDARSRDAVLWRRCTPTSAR